MKKLALVVALVLALLPSAASASAAEVSKAAPVPTVDQQTQGPLPWLETVVLIPFCSSVQGTSCTQVGSTKSCTDVCHDKLSCTCVLFNNQRFWNCQLEC